jgi:glycosyltransferase involved in cell wall biosynthesis
VSYALAEVELSAPLPVVQLAEGDTGIAIVSRRHGRVVGFAIHELAPGTVLEPEQVEALLDPHPAELAPSPGALCEVPSITVAVCTRDRCELLAHCLAALIAGGARPDEILVVDNAPSDNLTRDLARHMAVRYDIEPCPGLDFARNRALRTARSDVVAFVDDDVVVDTHWWESLQRVWNEHPAAGAVTGQVLPLELRTEAQVAFERRGGFRGGNDAICYAGQDLASNRTYPYSPGMFGAGANMSVRRATALRLGGFDEALDTGPPLPGGGDIDMMHRVIRSGAELVYEPQTVAFHRHRRDRDGLRRQYNSWGRSSMAVVAKTYRADREGRHKLRLYVRWFLLTQGRAALRGVTGRTDESNAAIAEICGGVAGLLGTYGRSRRRSRRLRRHHRRPVVAILPWGHVIEDYLDPIEVSIDAFADEQAGGWLFGFAEAFQRAGVDTTIVCWSRSVSRPTRRIHVPTGATLWLLPPARLYEVVRKRLEDPYAWDRRTAVGNRAGARIADAIAYAAAPFLATTMIPLARVLRRERCNVILCQEYEEGRFDVCVALGRLLRLPVFATFQGGDHTRTRLERLLRRRSVRSAAGLIIGADSEAARVRRHYDLPAHHIASLPNPFDPSTVPVIARDAARATLGIEVDVRVLVWHGRVDVHPKGIDTLIEAWREVRTFDAVPTVLLMLGTGSGADWLQRRIEELGFEDVRWRNEYILDRAVIGTYLSAADVYVLPSRQEGFPVALIEAMAAGLPLVATDAPGVRAVLGEEGDAGGTIVPVGDAHALAQAVRRYLGDEELASRTGACGRRRVAERFSLDGVGADLREFVLSPEQR